MQWFYAVDGSQQGPVSEEDLKARISSGMVRSGDLVWREGMAGWLAVSKVPELQSALPGASPSSASVPEVPATPVSAPAPNPVNPSPYQTPGSSVTSHFDPSQGANIPSYLWQSIVVTLLCCLPFGIVGIVYASKVDGYKRIGDFQAARSASNSAKLWVNLSAGVTLLLVVISVILNLLGFAASSN